MMVINNKFEIGQKVYLVSDPDQNVRIVTSFRIYMAGEIMYTVVCGIQESSHYHFELSEEKDLTMSVS